MNSIIIFGSPKDRDWSSPWFSLGNVESISQSIELAKPRYALIVISELQVIPLLFCYSDSFSARFSVEPNVEEFRDAFGLTGPSQRPIYLNRKPKTHRLGLATHLRRSLD
jgi:hypothetical protein